VGELYVSHEELIVAANTWAEAHGYALNIKRSSKNKRGIKNKIWLARVLSGKRDYTPVQGLSNVPSKQ